MQSSISQKVNNCGKEWKKKVSNHDCTFPYAKKQQQICQLPPHTVETFSVVNFPPPSRAHVARWVEKLLHWCRVGPSKKGWAKKKKRWRSFCARRGCNLIIIIFMEWNWNYFRNRKVYPRNWRGWPHAIVGGRVIAVSGVQMQKIWPIWVDVINCKVIQ